MLCCWLPIVGRGKVRVVALFAPDVGMIREQLSFAGMTRVRVRGRTRRSFCANPRNFVDCAETTRRFRPDQHSMERALYDQEMDLRPALQYSATRIGLMF